MAIESILLAVGPPAPGAGPCTPDFHILDKQRRGFGWSIQQATADGPGCIHR
jgi:hypothetical protein